MEGPLDQAAAMGRVARDRGAIEARVARDWGFELPESIFRFWAFLLTLGVDEEEGLYRVLDLVPFGIMELFEDPALVPHEGIDVRVHGRYYRDPPEFLTFMHGGSDGLHFGLWYDDGRTCTGVASYYNNDGGGVGLPLLTPLETVREELELTWRQIADDDEEWDPEDQVAVAALREALMSFETGDRPERGEEYLKRYGPSAELFEDGYPNRLETLDGGGVVAGGDTAAIDRDWQKPYSDYDFCVALRKELTQDPQALRSHVAEAHRRCALGDPTEALALGRDLHWASHGDPERERLANELLVLAYRALGRDSLAAIAEAHHRHRDIPTVGVLRS